MVAKLKKLKTGQRLHYTGRWPNLSRDGLGEGVPQNFGEVPFRDFRTVVYHRAQRERTLKHLPTPGETELREQFPKK